MKIKEELVAEVVKEASEKMSDPNYSAVMVGSFVQQQAATAQYIGAHAEELGGPEGVVNAIFHIALIAEAFKRAHNRTVRELSFDQLNIVSDGDREERLKDRQPAVVEYIKANIEEAEMRSVVMLVALAMDWVA
jgi:hypothetical protein